MEYKQIEAFLAIVEQKNITKAAESLFVSQSALSYRLKSLEAELGTTLIVRKKGLSNISLTLRGEAFLPIAREWMEVSRKVEAFRSNVEKLQLRITAPSSVNSVFSPVYNLIAESEPSVQLSVSTCNSNEIPEQILRRDADIGLGYFRSEKEDARLITEEIDTFPMVIIERTDIPRDSGEIDPATLLPEKAILIKGVSFDNPVAGDFYRKTFGADMPYYMLVDSPTMIANAMPAGGWCMIPRASTEIFENLPDYHIYSIKEPAPQMPCYLTMHQAIPRQLAELVKKYFY
ncbi:LysR family transcriptional regulator [Ihubacter sp. rT4E-8]|uniref:LysR family transcriptional regulator n=1 Tax=Ihubacter sp. rT4E-8 TaxID=3242369 RepID=UPI003CF13D61